MISLASHAPGTPRPPPGPRTNAKKAEKVVLSAEKYKHDLAILHRPIFYYIVQANVNRQPSIKRAQAHEPRRKAAACGRGTAGVLHAGVDFSRAPTDWLLVFSANTASDSLNSQSLWAFDGNANLIRSRRCGVVNRRRGACAVQMSPPCSAPDRTTITPKVSAE